MIFALCADSMGVGRVDASMLFDQQRMELFFTPVDGAKAHLLLSGNVDDACSWAGVQCREGKGVVIIDWRTVSVSLGGSIDMRILPEHLESLGMFKHEVFGEIVTTALPAHLSSLYIQFTKMHGTIDLGSLPASMEEICFEENRITAMQNFCNFPSRLSSIFIAEEYMATTAVRIEKLPVHFETLVIDTIDPVEVEFADASDASKRK